MTARLNNSQEMAEDFYLKVTQGEVNGHKWVHKFGATPSMSIGGSGSVWDINDTPYPWSAFDTASQVTVECVVGDTGQTITLQGLDASYNIIEETITLNDVTPPTSVNTYKRIYRAYMDTQTNTGNVDIKVGATIVARISAGKGQTLMAVYTVPAGCTGYVLQGIASCQSAGDASMDFRVRYPGTSVFRVGHSFEVSGHAPYDHRMIFPFPFPATSDLDTFVTATRNNNSRITAAFDVLLIQD